jgi:hypothetical protein
MSSLSESDRTCLFTPDSIENFVSLEVLEPQTYYCMDQEPLFGAYQWGGKAGASLWGYGPYDYASPAKSVKGEKGKSWNELVEVAEGQAMIEDGLQFSDLDDEPELPVYVEHCPEPVSEPSSNRQIYGKGNNPFGSKGCESCEFCRRRKGKVHPPPPLPPLSLL